MRWLVSRGCCCQLDDRIDPIGLPRALDREPQLLRPLLPEDRARVGDEFRSVLLRRQRTLAGAALRVGGELEPAAIAAEQRDVRGIVLVAELRVGQAEDALGDGCDPR